jgi:low temperature requirement protein LtrA
MAGLLVVSLCVPQVFGDLGLMFAVAYGVVRTGQIALFVLASPDDPDLRRSVLGLAASSAVAVGLLVVASFLDGVAQGSLWALAILLDFGGPALFGAEGWKLVPGHFAERHGLIVIIALGESIVAIGAGATDVTPAVAAAGALGVVLAATFWWAYFDVVAVAAERRLTAAPEGRDRNELARDGYSFLHLPMVAGIVLVALGLKKTVADVTAPLPAEIAAALCGGTALYLAAHVAFRFRLTYTVNRERLAAAVLLAALVPVGTLLPAWATVLMVTAVMVAIIGYETTHWAATRDRIRHEPAGNDQDDGG